jgi:hypothetical protein
MSNGYYSILLYLFDILLLPVPDILSGTRLGIGRGGYRANKLLEPILRSFPRPLIPWLLFLYRLAKYSHISLSAVYTISLSLIEANLVIKMRMVVIWNLFWYDCVLRNGS